MIAVVRLLRIAAVLSLLLSPTAQAAGHVGLAGQVTGTVTDQPQVPDVPIEHDLSGQGTTNLGPTAVHGSVSGTGFIPKGTCTGQLILSAASGTLTLSIGSASIAAFHECPTALTWRVTASSGALAGSAGSGSLRLTMAGGRFLLHFDGPGTPAPLALPTTGAQPWAPLAGLGLLLVALALGRHRTA